MKNENEITKNLLKDFNNEELVGRASFFNLSFAEKLKGRSDLKNELINYFDAIEIDSKKGFKTIVVKKLTNSDATLELVELEENRYAFGISQNEILRPLTGEDLESNAELLETNADFQLHPYWFFPQFLENR